jgi:hypothetical protein
MRAGVVVSARPGVEDLAVQAEELGPASGETWPADKPEKRPSVRWPRSR